MKLDPAKQYEVLVDLYKHFNEIILKSISLSYLLISSLIVFYLANQSIDGISALKALAYFFVAAAAILSLLASYLMANYNTAIRAIANDLELEFFPSTAPIIWFLRLNFVSMLALAYLVVRLLP